MSLSRQLVISVEPGVTLSGQLVISVEPGVTLSRQLVISVEVKSLTAGRGFMLGEAILQGKWDGREQGAREEEGGGVVVE